VIVLSADALDLDPLGCELLKAILWPDAPAATRRQSMPMTLAGAWFTAGHLILRGCPLSGFL
jgi:hypothetical protein